MPRLFGRVLSLCSLVVLLAGAGLFPSGASAATGPDATTEAQHQYLSGRGPADAVPWEFQVTAGRRAGEQTTIPVPSQWEFHGFGHYHYGEGDTRADERGLYRHTFRVTEAGWKQRRVFLVFEGVMTDATVRLNGERVGPIHQGGFYQFRYDVTKLLRFADPTKPDAPTENVLEVDVAKVSAEPGVHNAEHRADYWVFGGIYRPVYLEAVPVEAITHLAVDARADGRLTVDVEMEAARTADRVEAQLYALEPVTRDAASLAGVSSVGLPRAEGRPVGAPFGLRLPGGGTGRIRLAATFDAPRLWTAETPHLYRLDVRLRKGDQTLHQTSTRVGFRTIEVRPGDGIYVNGARVMLRGVNRHSFRPETGRALDATDSLEDVRLIQSMNMNAVRMSHYPPDQVFLDLCDELGLYVIDEIAGWQKSYSTVPAHRIVRATVRRDVNHPSVIIWANGNEGGWNRAVDGDYPLYDPQQRPVIHPWELFNDLNTKHYPTYALLTELLAGAHLVMPTEFLHGLFDGGHGAGLDDFWTAIRQSPRGAGGFLWVLADEGAVRSDRAGWIDVMGTNAPDGLVGPHHEKEGSFYTVRDLWSPVQLSAPHLTPDARLPLVVPVENRYNHTALAAARFQWALVRFPTPGTAASAATPAAPTVLTQGELAGPDLAPGARGSLEIPLPARWSDLGADALQLTATDATGRELWTWSWPTPALTTRLAAGPASAAATASTDAPVSAATGGEIRLTAGATVATFDTATGQLRRFARGAVTTPLTAGPRLVFARPAGDEASITWLPLTSASDDAAIATLVDSDPATTTLFREPSATLTFALPAPQPASLLEVGSNQGGWEQIGFTVVVSADGQHWRTLFAGIRTGNDGNRFTFAPQPVRYVRLSEPRTNGRDFHLHTVRLGHAPARFPAPTAPGAGVTVRHGRDSSGAWLEASGPHGLTSRWTLAADGSLRLEARYPLEGEFLYHGLTFDLPEEQFTRVRRLGQGPSRVWKNRMRGTWLGVHDLTPALEQPGQTWNYPEFAGYFAGTYWAELHTGGSRLVVTDVGGDPAGRFLRLGTPRYSQKNTSPEFPPGEVSFLHAIPGIGTKFNPPERLGPSGQPAQAAGEHRTSLVFRLLD